MAYATSTNWMLHTYVGFDVVLDLGVLTLLRQFVDEGKHCTDDQ